MFTIMNARGVLNHAHFLRIRAETLSYVHAALFTTCIVLLPIEFHTQVYVVTSVGFQKSCFCDLK